MSSIKELMLRAEYESIEDKDSLLDIINTNEQTIYTEPFPPTTMSRYRMFDVIADAIDDFSADDIDYENECYDETRHYRLVVEEDRIILQRSPTYPEDDDLDQTN